MNQLTLLLSVHLMFACYAFFTCKVSGLEADCFN